MKLGFICLNLPGHLNPMTALARRLQDRGHDVVFLYSSGAAGLPFVPGPEEDHVHKIRPQVSKMQGEDALQFSVRVLLDQTEAIPVTYDQPGVAARISHKQTGLVTSLDKLTADHLSTLLNEVLNDPTYRDNARKLQKAIAKANGLSVAADLVEECLGVTEKAGRA